MSTEIPQRLAVAFARRLFDALGADVMKEAIDKNKSYAANTCATHDYCDANMVMDAAFSEVVGHEIDLQNEGELAIWNEAWSIAKKAEFAR